MMRPLLACSIPGLLLLIACTSPGLKNTGRDWPQFRGPTAQGDAASTRLPLRWGESRNLAWKQALPGHGWSSPILQGDNLYLTTAVKGGNGGDLTLSLRALSLSATTGQVRWNVEVFKVGEEDVVNIHSKNSHASPTPLLVDNRIYVHFGHQGTACLDLNGKVIWRSADLKYPPVHGGGGSPVLAGDALIFSCDGQTNPFVAALHKNTGDVLWKTMRDTPAKKQFSFSTPLHLIVKGKHQVISPGSGAVCAYDPKTGEEIWKVRYGEGYSVVPRPVYGHGLVFISSGFDRPVVMAIRPDGKGNVTDTHVVWTLKKGAPHTPSLLLVGTELYMVSDGGIASCVDAETGAVHWNERIGGNYSASPIHADGRIYFQSEKGKGVVLQAGKEFRPLATNVLAEKTLASYAASDGALFIRSEKHLYKVEAR